MRRFTVATGPGRGQAARGTRQDERGDRRGRAFRDVLDAGGDRRAHLRPRLRRGTVGAGRRRNRCGRRGAHRVAHVVREGPGAARADVHAAMTPASGNDPAGSTACRAGVEIIRRHTGVGTGFMTGSEAAARLFVHCDHEGVGVLTGHDHEAAVGRENELARLTPVRRGEPGGAERALIRVEAEQGDRVAVGPPVGYEHGATGRRQPDRRGLAVTLEPLRQRRGGVGGHEAVPLAAQRDECVVELVDEQQACAARMEGEVPGAGLGRRLDPLPRALDELALVAQLVEQDGIDAEIRYEHVPTARVRWHDVGSFGSWGTRNDMPGHRSGGQAAGPGFTGGHR